MILRRTLQFLLFYIFSFFDLSIEAKEIITLPTANEVTTLPKGCLIENIPCSIMTPKKKKYEIFLGKTRIGLDEQTVVLRESTSEITLISGRIWVKIDGFTRIKSEYGHVEAQAGEFWVESKKNRTVFSNIFGELNLIPKGSSSPLKLYAGFENWLGPVDKHAQATSGIPMLISIEDHVYRWARLFPGKKTEFRKVVEEYFKEWQGHIEEASLKQEALVKRYIAHDLEYKQQALARRKAIEKEHIRVRDMMQKRMFITEPDKGL